MKVDEARRLLAGARISRRDVQLPGERLDAPPRQGVVVVRHGASGWEVVAEEYGQSELLARCSTEDEALDYVVQRLTTSLPTARAVDAGLVDRTRVNMAEHVAKVRETLSGASTQVVSTSLWDGAVVDRFGTLDGFLVWPEGTPLAQRSLPPDVLDPGFPQLGRLVLGCATEVPVLARLTAPWFGQPGGAVVMRLQPGTTVRDLVADGRMLLLDVPD